MIYIVRHGQTARNKANVLQGRSDVPLNETGRQQAEELRKRFAAAGIHFDRIYTSPLVRAVRTAELIVGAAGETGAAVQTGAAVEAGEIGAAEEDYVRTMIDGRLIEMDYGPYEGMDLYHPAPEVIEFFRDFVRNPVPAGMEALENVVARMGQFLEDIREEILRGARGDAREDVLEDIREKAADMDILVSTHAIAMKGALEYLTPDSHGSYWAKHIGNCGVYVTGIHPDGSWIVPKEW